jgi:hypothetical protein
MEIAGKHDESLSLMMATDLKQKDLALASKVLHLVLMGTHFI